MGCLYHLSGLSHSEVNVNVVTEQESMLGAWGLSLHVTCCDLVTVGGTLRPLRTSVRTSVKLGHVKLPHDFWVTGSETA